MRDGGRSDRRKAIHEAPYARGRLVTTPLGAGRFTIEVIRGADEWALRAHPTIVVGICPESETQPRMPRES